MQAQRDQQLQARIPLPFTRLLKVLYYTNILFLILSLVGMSRMDILVMLPMLSLAAFLFWIIAHWVSLGHRQRSIYILDAETGITDRAYAAGGMQVHWDEIVQVQWTTWGGFRGLKIVLRDNRAALARLSLFDRITAYINHACYGSPFVFWQAWSDRPLEEFEAAIRERLSLPETK